MAKLKHAQARRVDESLWVFGGIIAVLALLDLFVWATLWNVPNPLSAVLLGPPPAQTMPLPRALFIDPKHGYPGGMTGNSR
jgi:hypothetical protein